VKSQEQRHSSSLRYCALDKISRPIEEMGGKEKTLNFQYPCEPWAFYKAFQPSVNYSRQRRRTRTLSAITLHPPLPSVSNINVMAFIFSRRLWTRGQCSSLHSFPLLICQSIYDIWRNKKPQCALVPNGWSGHLKTAVWKNKRYSIKRWGLGCYLLSHNWESEYYITRGWRWNNLGLNCRSQKKHS